MKDNKKSFILTPFLFLFTFSKQVSASSYDFIVKDGVLLSYIGNSETVTVPSHVTSIGKKAFYSWNEVNGRTIYCTRDSAAYRYAIKNNLKIVLS